MSQTSPVLVIAASVRPRRLCIQIAEWVAGVGEEATKARLEVVDLKDWRLPMDFPPPFEGVRPHAAARPSSNTGASSAGRAGRPRIMSAAFSAIMMVGALVLPPTSVGMTEASTTLRP